MAGRREPRKKRATGGRPVTGPKARGERTPIIVEPDYGSRQIRFRFDLIDFDDWCMHDMSKPQHKRTLKRLQHIEMETLDQARRNDDVGDYSVEELRAKNRSAYVKYRNKVDDAEYLCKVVVGNSQSERIFGYRDGNVIHIIWFDPNHEVWPEGKRVR